MSKKTNIEWTDGTVNPTLGCDGCELWSATTGVKLCYAGTMTARFGRSNPGLADDFDVVATAPDRMMEAASWSDLRGDRRTEKPWLDGLPRLIFIGDMADSFSRDISFEYLRDEVITAVSCHSGQRHQWQWLTKRPQRMAEFSRWLSETGSHWPSNLWAGTSVTTQATTSRIEALSQVGNSKTLHFVSVEPQWESIDLTDFLPSLDWVIHGGHSGTSRQAGPQGFSDDEWKEIADHAVQVGHARNRAEATRLASALRIVKSIFVDVGIANPTPKQLFRATDLLTGGGFTKFSPSDVERSLTKSVVIADQHVRLSLFDAT